MTGEQIYRQFSIIFRSIVSDVKSFTRKDEHTIGIKLKNGKKYIFKYDGTDNFMVCSEKYIKK